MHAQSLDEISVQDITGAATVNRATFYDHYNDKFALFEATVAGEFHKLLQERNVTFDGTCLFALSAVILAVCDYLTETHAQSTNCLGQSAFEPLLEAAVTTSIKRILLPGVRQQASASKSFLTPEIIANATSCAIYGAVKEWFYTPDHPPAEQIVPQILPLILRMAFAGELPSDIPNPSAASHP